MLATLSVQQSSGKNPVQQKGRCALASLLIACLPPHRRPSLIPHNYAWPTGTRHLGLSAAEYTRPVSVRSSQ
jgi:hypothetical protein